MIPPAVRLVRIRAMVGGEGSERDGDGALEAPMLNLILVVAGTAWIVVFVVVLAICRAAKAGDHALGPSPLYPGAPVGSW